MIPKDPSKFKSEFSYYYIEDENGEIPKCYEGIISHIPLECIVENNTIKLFGKLSPFKCKCFDLKINNHNYGMIFLITCNNTNENIKDKAIWRRSIDRVLLHDLFNDVKENEINVLLEGDAPEIANCPVSIATVKIVKNKRDYHINYISIEISLEMYDLFIQRYED